MRRTPMTLTAGAAVVGALLLAGCAPTSTDAGTPTPSRVPTPSATTGLAPSATPYAVPAEEPDEIARVIFDDAAEPASEITSGPAAVEADVDFGVRGECEGGESIEFEVTKAAPGAQSGELLMGGTIDCATGSSGRTTFRSDYFGPAQLTLLDLAEAERAWAVVRPAPSSAERT